MIVAKKIYKKYGHRTIIKNFNYHFEEGLYLVTGKSGKGKTTMLKILAQVDKECDGIVFYNNNIFFLNDKDNLVNELTVFEHFKIFQITYNYKINDYFNIKYLFNRKIKKLSLGEQQLVNLTLALNCSEKIIILDEPLSALSIENDEKAAILLQNRAKQKTIILSTHCKEVFDKYIEINIEENYKNIPQINCNKGNLNKREFKYYYLLLYLKKTLLKKIFFTISLLSTIFSFFFFNNYLDKEFNTHMSYFKENQGIVISKTNDIKDGLNQDIFYEVIKQLSPYVIDYNANYYSSHLYNYDIAANGYYIDNGFIFSSIKYIEENLEDNEIVLGLNYNEFCHNNNIGYCEAEYIKTLLINTKIEPFSLEIKYIFEVDENTVFSNKRFFYVLEKCEYEEYYFDILKRDKNNVFKLVNENNFLRNFSFVNIGENEEYLRYRLELKEYKYFGNIDYQKYIVCLDKGYDCLDYLNHFSTLGAIDNFVEMGNLNFNVIDMNLNIEEIIISSSLSEKLNKGVNSKITFYFEYNDVIISQDFIVKKIVTCDDYVIYQNSD